MNMWYRWRGIADESYPKSARYASWNLRSSPQSSKARLRAAVLSNKLDAGVRDLSEHLPGRQGCGENGPL